MTSFTCDNLTPEEAATAYPLVREAVPGLNLQAWLRYARRIANPRHTARTGIIAVRRRSRPLPCGLFLYHRDHDLMYGSTLVAEHMVAIDLLDPDPVLQVLLEAMEALAVRLDCQATRIVVAGQEAFIASHLRAAGHHVDGEMMWKVVRNTEGVAGRA
jgi:hypothetical protein